MEMTRAWVADFFAGCGVSSKPHFCRVDMSDCSAIIEALFLIEREFPDCVMEITGGKYLALLAAGMFAETTDIPIFHYDIDRRCFANIRGCKEADNVTIPYLSARNFFELSHAGTIGYGHFSPPKLDDEARTDALNLWPLFLANRSSWHRIINFFQGIEHEAGKPLYVNTFRSIKGMSLVERDSFLRKLEDAGLILDLKTSSGHARFTYKTPVVKAMLQDAGASLELFTYTCIKKHPELFRDCEINLRIDWDGDGPSATSNELDVVAVRGLNPLFISCKSGRLETAHLNEIFTVTSKLGGLFAKPVLMTASLTTENDNKWMVQRANDIGIAQLGLNDICPLFAENKYCGLSSCLGCETHECEHNLAHVLADFCDNGL